MFCGWDGVGALQAEGVSMRKFKVRQAVPGLGLRGIVAPGLAATLLKRSYDIVHVHLARDLITLDVARRVRRRGIPYVVQPHGMVMPDRRLRARVTDQSLTRAALHGAAAVLSLNELESEGLMTVAGPETRCNQLLNGVAALPDAGMPRDTSSPPDVLFLARLHARKRVQIFADMAALLVERGVRARFSVVGPDEGELAPLLEKVSQHGLESHLTYEGAIAHDDVPERMARASVFVLPSVDEPFGMTILEALAAGTPTVVTDSVHLSRLLATYDAALVTRGTPTDLADAVEQVLHEPALVERLKAGSQRVLTQEFAISKVVDQLEGVYARAVASVAT